jgi:hypothetical protein
MGPQVIGLLVIPNIKALKMLIDENELGKQECDELLLDICVDHYKAGEQSESLLSLYGDYKDAVRMRE